MLIVYPDVTGIKTLLYNSGEYRGWMGAAAYDMPVFVSLQADDFPFGAFPFLTLPPTISDVPSMNGTPGFNGQWNGSDGAVMCAKSQWRIAGGFNTSNPQIILSGLDNTNDHTKIYQNWVNWDFGLHPISPANPVTQTQTLTSPTTITFSPADAQSAIHGNYGEIGFRSAAV
jgi:hypothetical protein